MIEPVTCECVCHKRGEPWCDHCFDVFPHYAITRQAVLNRELVAALKNIKRHVEISLGAEAAKLSTVWVIAVAALGKVSQKEGSPCAISEQQ